MATYVHLLADDLPASPFGAEGGNQVGTQPTETRGEAIEPEAAETAETSQIA
jgi:hypothetical protein